MAANIWNQVIAEHGEYLTDSLHPEDLAYALLNKKLIVGSLVDVLMNKMHSKQWRNHELLQALKSTGATGFQLFCTVLREKGCYSGILEKLTGHPQHVENAPPQPSQTESNSTVLTMKGPEQDEYAYFHGADRRVRVIDHLKSHPYIHIMRMELTKDCCAPKSKRQGTCFLVCAGQPDGDNRFFLTAGHNLFCYEHSKYINEVALYADEDQFVASLPNEHYRGSFKVNPDYLKHCANEDKRRALDYGVVVLHKDDIIPKFVDQSRAFQVVEAITTEMHCTATGYPIKVKINGRNTCGNTKLYTDHDSVDVIDCYRGCDGRLLKHLIDTSGGQSGCPVYIRDQASNQKTAVGIHIGWGSYKQATNDDPDCNLAVLLDRARLDEILGWSVGNEERVNVPQTAPPVANVAGATASESLDDRFMKGDLRVFRRPEKQLDNSMAKLCIGQTNNAAKGSPGVLEPTLCPGSDRETTRAQQATDPPGKGFCS